MDANIIVDKFKAGIAPALLTLIQEMLLLVTEAPFCPFYSLLDYITAVS